MSNYATLTESINNATFDSDNWNADGSINWSFVDADAYADCFDMYDKNFKEFYNDFDEIVTAIRVQMREEALSEARFEMMTS